MWTIKVETCSLLTLLLYSNCYKEQHWDQWHANQVIHCDEDEGADLGDGLHLHKGDLSGDERFHLRARTLDFYWDQVGALHEDQKECLDLWTWLMKEMASRLMSGCSHVLQLYEGRRAVAQAGNAQARWLKFWILSDWFWATNIVTAVSLDCSPKTWQRFL